MLDKGQKAGLVRVRFHCHSGLRHRRRLRSWAFIVLELTENRNPIVICGFSQRTLRVAVAALFVASADSAASPHSIIPSGYRPDMATRRRQPARLSHDCWSWRDRRPRHSHTRVEVDVRALICFGIAG